MRPELVTPYTTRSPEIITTHKMEPTSTPKHCHILGGTRDSFQGVELCCFFFEYGKLSVNKKSTLYTIMQKAWRCSVIYTHYHYLIGQGRMWRVVCRWPGTLLAITMFPKLFPMTELLSAAIWTTTGNLFWGFPHKTDKGLAYLQMVKTFYNPKWTWWLACSGLVNSLPKQPLSY